MLEVQRQFKSINKVKRLLAPLRRTPLHPQWLLRGDLRRKDLSDMQGRILDVGCAGGGIARLLPEGAQYIGLDHYDTATGWYRTRPQVFADAQALPVATDSLDGILMLHVLEHLPSPGIAIGEASRALRPGGLLLVETPFFYPLHDAPLDFHRWTPFGLQADLEQAGLKVRKIDTCGQPVETAVVMLCLAIGALNLEWLERRSPALLLSPLLWLLIPLLNLVGWLLGRFGGNRNFMPHKVRALATKAD